MRELNFDKARNITFYGLFDLGFVRILIIFFFAKFCNCSYQ